MRLGSDEALRRERTKGRVDVEGDLKVDMVEKDEVLESSDLAAKARDCALSLPDGTKDIRVFEANEELARAGFMRRTCINDMQER